MPCQIERPSDANAPPVPGKPLEPAGLGAYCDAAITSKQSLAEIADRRLLAAMATGSRSALARLHSEYFLRLVNFFVHLMPLSAPEVVDDLIADTLFDVWHQCATFASDSSVHVAIMRVAWAHGSRRLANSEACRPSPEALTGSRGGQTQLLSRTASPQLLSEVFEAFSPSGRAIIHLVYAGHSRQEVADVLSISCEAVDACLTSLRTAHHARLVSSDTITTGASWSAEH
jgi:DNA-directed RNA polymerase specialized sigma24 family protein